MADPQGLSLGRIFGGLLALVVSALFASAAPAQSGPYVLPAYPAAGVMPDAPRIDPGHAYTLAELIDVAESTNPETRIAWNAARDAVFSVDLARGSFLPRLSATVLGGYTTGDSRQTALGVQAGGGSQASGTVSALSLEWLLFDFGERSAVLKGARIRAQIGDIRFTQAHQRLIHEVSLAYYLLQTTLARAAASDASLRDAQTVQAAAEARFRHGIGTVIEIAQAKQATAQAVLEQVRTQGDAQDARLALLAAMGLPPLMSLKVASLPKRPLSRKLAGPVDEVIRNALARRPDVQAAYAASQASLADVEVARAAGKPKVFVTANGNYTSGDLALSALPSAGNDPATLNVSGHRFGGTVLGGIRIPIFDGGARRTAVAQARNRAASAAAALDRVKLDSAQQIASAQNKLVTSLSAHEAAVALLQAAQTTYNAALDAYRSGVGSATDMQLADRQLIEARNVETDSYFGALSAAATLALSTGELGAAPQ